MADSIRILNWNVAGAKYLETKDIDEREEHKRKVNEKLAAIIKDFEESGKRAPHIITLQETVQYKIPGQDEVDFIEESKFPDYDYLTFPIIDNRRHSYTSKWKNMEKFWPENTYFAQGNSILSKKDLPISPIWSLARSSRHERKNISFDGQPYIQHKHQFVEKVSIESGLYFGDRNTEPRSALVSHFIFDRDDDDKYKDEKTHLPIPLDVFVVNLHLTTLTYEREGVPEVDEEAAKIRLKQLEVVFSGIISRYNRWAKSGFLTRGYNPTLGPDETTNRFKPLWILCGDFNFTPESEEYQYIIRRNFVDTIPIKGMGTKSRGRDAEASLTVDYIFAGPNFVSLEYHDGIFRGNEVIQNTTCSDHRAIYAKIPLAYI